MSAKDIAAVLRSRILDGSYPRRSVLPSRRALSEEFGTSETTITWALRPLRREGLVSPEQGRGTIVTHMPRITRDARDRYNESKRADDRGGFAAEVRRQSMTPRSETVVRREVPPARVAELLGTEPEQEVLVRYREMYADDVLMQIAPSYIPGDIAFGTQLEDHTQPQGGMLTTMRELGHEEVYADEYLTLARVPDQDEIDRFGISEDQPVFELFHQAYDNAGRVVEVSWHRGPCSRWAEFIYRVRIKEQD
ncbi:GntR family transcriptional regulator [Actinomadura rupiterrae]|uniref:GntR family transcriptional regulator n=1 Tax=Actinomadura rupiterrae TaxID=559627 RepID=UPI0020A27C27|nr:GntR family transcriptional regulator [Actinomadura rupiterrae]MCP2341620.1 GntR family transcriptional regulator [Actinomadura rupiterrae]